MSSLSDLPSSPLSIPSLTDGFNDSSLDFDIPLSMLPESQNPIQNQSPTPSQNNILSNNESYPVLTSPNGRVQQINQDGKLKLRISLKGLQDKSNTANDTQLSENSVNINSQLTQSIIPPTHIHNQLEERPSESSESSAVFSDDINLSELEENSIASKKLSPNLSFIKSNHSFLITFKFSEQNKFKLHPENLNSLKSPKPIPPKSPSTRKPSKAGKPKTIAKKRPKRRPKPLYSRYMVKYATGPEIVDSNATAGSDNNSNDDGLIEQSVRLSLKDPLSGLRMVTPLRTKYCSHVECFDYESFLAMYNLKPFKLAIKRFDVSSVHIGDNIDILKLLEDTKRQVLDAKIHNINTTSFPYKSKLRQLKEKGKNLNELEWFCCPICKLEFNIKRIGDVYVIGEFVDLLQDLLFEENNENVIDIEIDMSNNGKWHWIREENDDQNTSNTNNTPGSGESNPIMNSLPIENAQSNPSSASIISKKNNVEVVTLDSEDEQNDDENTIVSNNVETTQAIINKVAPFIQAVNPHVNEDEISRELDKIFAAEGFPIGRQPPPNTTTRQIPNQPPQFQASKLHQGVVGFRPGAFVIDSDSSSTNHVFMVGDGAADDPIVLD